MFRQKLYYYRQNQLGVSASFGPRQAALILLGLFVALTVGTALSAARNDVALPLIGKCPAVLSSDISPTAWIIATTECGIGLLLILAVPGAIGVFLMTSGLR